MIQRCIHPKGALETHYLHKLHLMHSLVPIPLPSQRLTQMHPSFWTNEGCLKYPDEDISSCEDYLNTISPTYCEALLKDLWVRRPYVSSCHSIRRE